LNYTSSQFVLSHAADFLPEHRHQAPPLRRHAVQEPPRDGIFSGGILFGFTRAGFHSDILEGNNNKLCVCVCGGGGINLSCSWKQQEAAQLLCTPSHSLHSLLSLHSLHSLLSPHRITSTTPMRGAHASVFMAQCTPSLHLIRPLPHLLLCPILLLEDDGTGNTGKTGKTGPQPE